MKIPGSKFLKSSGGTSAVEFALVMPVCLLFLFGIIELGYVLWGDSSLKYAATLGSRYAFANPSASATTIQNYALSKVLLSGSNINFTVTTSSTTVNITGTFTYTFLVIPISPITITTQINQSVPTNT